MINVFDCKENNSCISKNKLANNSEFLKYEIIYPKIVIDQKYIENNNYDKYTIQRINYMIYNDIINHKESIEKQAIEYEKNYNKDNFKYKYQLYIDFKLGYDKNDIISIIAGKYVFMGNPHDRACLTSYNYILKTGEKINLRDLFRKDVDYKLILNKFILNDIRKNKKLILSGDNIFKGINEDQKFYLTKDAINIYFEIYGLDPYNVYIPIFKIYFKEIIKYLNPKYICI